MSAVSFGCCSTGPAKMDNVERGAVRAVTYGVAGAAIGAAAGHTKAGLDIKSLVKKPLKAADNFAKSAKESAMILAPEGYKSTVARKAGLIGLASAAVAGIIVTAIKAHNAKKCSEGMCCSTQG